MNLDDHIKSLLTLGEQINQFEDPALQSIINQAYSNNNWFDRDEIRKSLNAWSALLTESNLIEWSSKYDFKTTESKTVGLIMAGNIPLVGLHDLISVLITNHKAMVKLSSKDNILMKYIIFSLYQINVEYKERIQIVERFKNQDAIIATGSNNSSRYFEAYFGKYPNIIRKNRTSIAVLDGSETEEELKALGQDIFTYFGLGCRNITKIYIPEDFELERFFVAIEDFKDVMHNNKYKNNYDYNCTILLMNKAPFLSNNFLMLKEDESIHSATATVHYERYKDEADLQTKLDQLDKEEIQCISGKQDQYIDLGSCQKPHLWDYADNIDTVEFLLNLEKQK